MKRNAFTLAEVLITLGIIGVVAAITLPTLIQNYQKKTYVEGLKVGISTFEQGFRKAMADDGVTDFKDTELYKACDYHTLGASLLDSCQVQLKKYFKAIRFYDINQAISSGVTSHVITDPEKCKQFVGTTNARWYLNDKTKCRGWYNLTITLANGMIADFFFDSSYPYDVGEITLLDVNGVKGPNKWGRDSFMLRVTKQGRVIPAWGYEFIKLKTDYEKIDIEAELSTNHWSRNDFCSQTTTASGIDCGARVIESGWKMDY